MATSKSPAEIEDTIIRRIFHVTLAKATDADPMGVVFLEMKLAALFLSEGEKLLRSRTLMENVLIDRLCGHFSAAEPPFPYLIGCYRRAQNELKKIQSMKDNNLRSAMEIVARKAKTLAVSYCRKYLADPDLFADRDITRGRQDKGYNWFGRLMTREVSPILPLILAKSSSSEVRGFLHEFFNDSDIISLDRILKELYEDLISKVMNVSLPLEISNHG